MKLYLNLLIKKTLKGEDQRTRILIDNVPELKALEPDEITFEKWREFSTKVWLESGKLEMLNLKTSKENFYNIVKKAYKFTGKEIEVYDEKINSFRIPMKEGFFFECINKLELYSDIYENNIIILKIK